MNAIRTSLDLRHEVEYNPAFHLDDLQTIRDGSSDGFKAGFEAPTRSAIDILNMTMTRRDLDASDRSIAYFVGYAIGARGYYRQMNCQPAYGLSARQMNDYRIGLVEGTISENNPTRPPARLWRDDSAYQIKPLLDPAVSPIRRYGQLVTQAVMLQSSSPPYSLEYIAGFGAGAHSVIKSKPGVQTTGVNS